MPLPRPRTYPEIRADLRDALERATSAPLFEKAKHAERFMERTLEALDALALVRGTIDL